MTQGRPIQDEMTTSGDLNPDQEKMKTLGVAEPKQENEKIQEDSESERGIKLTQNEPEQGDRKIQWESQQDFIPGLPHDVVLEHIVTRIPWSSMFALACVNQGWRGAIRGRKIYNFRMDLGASQLMIVAPVESLYLSLMGFYEAQSKQFWLFPKSLPLPDSAETRRQVSSSADKTKLTLVPRQASVASCAIQHTQNMAILGGKLYAIRQRWGAEGWKVHKTEEILMLDVAACQTTWKIYAITMNQAPTSFFAACNGKMYAFHTFQSSTYGKVFDPESNEWTKTEHRSLPSIDDVSACRFGTKHRTQVAVLDKGIYFVNRIKLTVFDTIGKAFCKIPNNSVILCHDNNRYADFSIVVHQGKMYSFCCSQVEVYNAKSNTWTILQRTVYEDFARSARICWPYSEVVAVASYGIEVLAVLQAPSGHRFSDGNEKNLCKSVGFGIEGKVLTWKKIADFPVSCCLGFDYLKL